MSNNSFLDLTQITVPRSVIDSTMAHLRSAGSHGYEGITLWAGTQEGFIFSVKENVIPAQIGRRTAQGVSVSVEADELHRLNVWLFKNGMRLIAQIHSHPGEAYHSEMDDHFAIAAVSGSISIVVPDFGKDPFALDGCAIYRLVPGMGWIHMDPANVRRLISIDGDPQSLSGHLSAGDSSGIAANENAEEAQTQWPWPISLIRRLWPRHMS